MAINQDTINNINYYSSTSSDVSITDFPTALKPAERSALEFAGRIPASSSSGGNVSPSHKLIDHIKQKLLNPALTSHYQCWFNPPGDVITWIEKNRGFNYKDSNNKELISLSCSEASLPGSALMTNEINDDHTGVTERHAYRRQYDDRSDFTFYVDNGNYNVLWFFEQWMQYVVDEQFVNGLEDNNYFYRVNFPKSYQTNALYLNKFERNYIETGTYLEYKFLQAYPINISSMPVSYDSSQLLKCTVSFTYSRYVVRRKRLNQIDSVNREPQKPQIPGIPSTQPQPSTPAPFDANKLQRVITNEYYNNGIRGTNFNQRQAPGDRRQDVTNFTRDIA